MTSTRNKWVRSQGRCSEFPSQLKIDEDRNKHPGVWKSFLLSPAVVSLQSVLSVRGDCKDSKKTHTKELFLFRSTEPPCFHSWRGSHSLFLIAQTRLYRHLVGNPAEQRSSADEREENRSQRFCWDLFLIQDDRVRDVSDRQDVLLDSRGRRNTDCVYIQLRFIQVSLNGIGDDFVKTDLPQKTVKKKTQQTTRKHRGQISRTSNRARTCAQPGSGATTSKHKNMLADQKAEGKRKKVEQCSGRVDDRSGRV